jgi:hypothetical protein
VDTTPYWIGGIGSALGGLGAAVGAIFAGRAAGRSSKAADDARNALALSTRPEVDVWIGQPSAVAFSPIVARAWIWSPWAVWPAVDVVIQYRLRVGPENGHRDGSADPCGSNTAPTPSSGSLR